MIHEKHVYEYINLNSKKMFRMFTQLYCFEKNLHKCPIPCMKKKNVINHKKSDKIKIT